MSSPHIRVRFKGKGKAAATKPKGRVVETWTWDTHRVKLLQGMRNVLLANLERVWSPVKPEEEFAALFVSTALSALENAAVAKDKDARSAAVGVLLRSAAVMGQRINVVSGVINILHHHEHMPGPAVELVVAAAQQGERDFVSEIMREFGCVPMNELARDASAARNFAGFLSELSEVMPGDGWMPMPVPPYYLLKPYYSTSLQLAPAAKVRPWNGAQPAPGTAFRHDF